MKVGKGLILIMTFLFASAMTVEAQGIEFFHGKWEEALAQAKKENKLIFLDAYAAWCGPCKRLSRNVFPQKEAGDFFNPRFISFKQDMEKGEGLSLRKKYPVRAFPTLFFIDPDGNIVQQSKGAPRTPKALIELAARALEKYDGADKYEALYKEGKRDYHTMYNYVKALNRNRESSVKVANEYLDTQEDYSTPENLRFIFEATTRLDSRIFDLFEEYKEKIAAQHGQQEVADKLKEAAWNTVYTGIQFDTYMLVPEAQEKYARHVTREAATEFRFASDLMYFRKHKMEAEYLEAAEEYIDSNIGEESDKMYSISMEVRKVFGDSPEAMEWAEKLAAKAAREKAVEPYQLHYADILVLNDKRQKAEKFLEKCIDHAIKEGAEYKRLQGFLDKLQNG